jgi:hypothetical protein
MKYRYNALDEAEFVIPDEWLEVARFREFRAIGNAYNVGAPEVDYPQPGTLQLIPLSEIEHLTRSIGVGGFIEDRMIPILKGIRRGDRLPPIIVIQLQTPNRFQYRLYHGFHRYHASIAAGFTHIPAFISLQNSYLIEGSNNRTPP